MADVTMTPLSFDDDGEISFKVSSNPILEEIENKKAEQAKKEISTQSKEITDEKVDNLLDKDALKKAPPVDITKPSDDLLDFGSEEEKEDEELNKFLNPKEEQDSKEKGINQESVDFNSMAQMLIDNGVWGDWDGRDKQDLTQEDFTNLWFEQAEYAAKQAIAQEKEKFGKDANEFIEFLKNGGNLEELATQYRQELDIKSLDLSDDSNKERVIREYYESLGRKKEQIDKHINRLKDSGKEEFDEEAEICKEGLVSAIQEERQTIVEEQARIAEDKRLQAETFNKQLKAEIHKSESIHEKDKKAIDKFYFEPKYTDSQGNKYTEFQKTFMEFQKDPKKWAKVVQFFQNPEQFENKTVVENKTTNKIYKFFKDSTNSKISENGSFAVEKTKKATNKGLTF